MFDIQESKVTFGQAVTAVIDYWTGDLWICSELDERSAARSCRMSRRWCWMRFKRNFSDRTLWRRCLCAPSISSSQPDVRPPGAELGPAGRGPDPSVHDPPGRGDLHTADCGTGEETSRRLTCLITCYITKIDLCGALTVCVCSSAGRGLQRLHGHGTLFSVFQLDHPQAQHPHQGKRRLQVHQHPGHLRIWELWGKILNTCREDTISDSNILSGMNKVY